MKLLETFLNTPSSLTYGWTLLHLLWQGRVLSRCTAGSACSPPLRMVAPCSSLRCNAHHLGLCRYHLQPLIAIEHSCSEHYQNHCGIYAGNATDLRPHNGFQHRLYGNGSLAHDVLDRWRLHLLHLESSLLHRCATPAPVGNVCRAICLGGRNYPLRYAARYIETGVAARIVARAHPHRDRALSAGHSDAAGPPVRMAGRASRSNPASRVSSHLPS